MSWRNPKFWQNSSIFLEQLLLPNEGRLRCYSTKSRIYFNRIRPMILRRIENRARNYPLTEMIPVANEVIRSRAALYDGVSSLLHHFPVWSCKFCPEVYVGEEGHLIKSCYGYKRTTGKMLHSWVKGTVKDVLVSVETFHLREMFQKEICHDERFDYDRIPAVVELCLQAGVDSNDEIISSYITSSSNQGNSSISPGPLSTDIPAVVELCLQAGVDSNDEIISSYTTTSSNQGNISISPEPLSTDDLRVLGLQTYNAWETLRSGVEKLLCVYPARVCKHCSEVHVGPSGHKARLCGVFKHEEYRGKHFWVRASVDDLVPPNLVWYRRRQDPPILVEEGRNYYGHAPAVVDLCSKAGAIVSGKYFCMMKADGLSPTVDSVVKSGVESGVKSGVEGGVRSGVESGVKSPVKSPVKSLLKYRVKAYYDD